MAGVVMIVVKEIVMGKKLLAPSQVVRIEELLEMKDEWGRCKYSHEQIAGMVMCSPSTVGRISRKSAAYAQGNAQVLMARGERMLDAGVTSPELDRAAAEFQESFLKKLAQGPQEEKTIVVEDPVMAAKLIELGAQHVKAPPSPMDGGDAPEESDGSGLNKLFTTKGDGDGK